MKVEFYQRYLDAAKLVCDYNLNFVNVLTMLCPPGVYTLNIDLDLMDLTSGGLVDGYSEEELCEIRTLQLCLMSELCKDKQYHE